MKHQRLVFILLFLVLAFLTACRTTNCGCPMH